MMKKKVLLLAVLALLLTAGCGEAREDSAHPPADVKPVEGASEDGQAEKGPSEEDPSQQSLSEEIAAEISRTEEQEKVVEKKQEAATTQPEMNKTAEEMYQLWDDTLNAVWKLLEASLSEADMDALRKEELQWIASKEAEVRAAGLENEGGSIQPLVEAMTGAELTRARVYELAEYAEAR